MPEETQSVVCASQAWLQSAWHVQVPFAWLEACVEWLQGEAGGADHLSQQQINQQVLDQWLLTDLRDLDYPVLPEGLAQAQKTELSGTFCVQVDSLLDISQPAYGQLQKWRGTDCSNDEVSAVTQNTQRPWEAKSTRMLLLQVTDGVQSLEAMEYQSIPALSAGLRPGAKLQLQGPMVCRLGVLLLSPLNVKILGGEVEDLVERNSQGKMLCRALGVPEEEEEELQQEEEGRTEAPTSHHENQEIEDLEMENDELLASLEEQGEANMLQAGSAQDSGYETLQQTSTLPSRSSFARSLVSSRSEISTPSDSSALTQSSGVFSVRAHSNGGQQQGSDLPEFVPFNAVHQNNQEDTAAGDEFPDEEFDDLPLDELDNVILQESENVMAHSDSSRTSTFENNSKVTGNPGSVRRALNPQTPQFEPHALSGSGRLKESGNSRFNTQKRDHQGHTREASHLLNTATSKPSQDLQSVTNNENDFMDEDMDCLFQEIEDSGVKSERTGGTALLPSTKTGTGTHEEKSYNPSTSKCETVSSKSERNVPAVTLTSAPFTYLCLLKELMTKPPPHPIEIHVKAFIVTLLGKLSSSNGVWSVCATISDGTGYLDVELSNEVLTNLLGFSVAEKAALKRDPARRGELDSGMKRCQEKLVDMCCIMMIVVEPEKGRGVVAKAEPANERVFQQLEQRVGDRRK